MGRTAELVPDSTVGKGLEGWYCPLCVESAIISGPRIKVTANL